MSYSSFVRKMNILASQTGLAVWVNDNSDGKLVARFSDGTTITGNSSSYKVTVKWGSGHAAMAEI